MSRRVVMLAIAMAVAHLCSCDLAQQESAGEHKQRPEPASQRIEGDATESGEAGSAAAGEASAASAEAGGQTRSVEEELGLLPQSSLPDEVIDEMEKLSPSQIKGMSADEAQAMLVDHGIGMTADVLVESCMFGWENLLALLLRAGIDPNLKREDGGNALTAACHRGSASMVRTLLAHGADIESTFDAWESTCMHFAAQGGSTEVIDLLCDAGLDVDARNKFGQTALMTSAQAAQVEIVRHLLAKGGDANAISESGQTPLMWAVRSGSLEAAKLLVEHGADIEHADHQAGVTPLLAAVMFGYRDVFEYMWELGADPAVLLKDGSTIMHLAAFGGNADIVRALAEAGFDVNAKRREGGETPLFMIGDSPNPNPACVKAFVEHGADLNAVNDEGMPLLSWISGLCLPEMLRLALELGADVAVRDGQGNTGLHLAAMYDDIARVEIFLEFGADPAARNNDGKTPLVLAEEGGYEAVAEVLRKALSERGR